MSHRVKKYLLNLNVITNEDELRELSLNSEPPPGSGMKLTPVNKISSCYDRPNRLCLHHCHQIPIFGLFTSLDTIVLVCGRVH